MAFTQQGSTVIVSSERTITEDKAGDQVEPTTTFALIVSSTPHMF
nr:hypothetical protein Itr_chr01CG21370 [Ipomoea trifida]